MRGGPFTPRKPSAVATSASTSRRAVTGLEARYSASNSPRMLYRPPARSEPMLESAVAPQHRSVGLAGCDGAREIVDGADLAVQQVRERCAPAERGMRRAQPHTDV